MAYATRALAKPSYLDELPLASEAFKFTAERHPLEVGALLHIVKS